MKILSKILSNFQRWDDKPEKWPCPENDLQEEPFFLFIITPPRSGSTALAQILNSAKGTSFLNKRAEGQWLVPGMCEADRWDPQKEINWQSVRAVWLKRVESILVSDPNVNLIIEKSPPNLVRIDQIIKVFPNHSLLAFNRDPYANCASTLYRNYDINKLNESDRIEIITQIAENWLKRSRLISQWIDNWDIVYFTYEDFCEDPGSAISKLYVEIPSLKTVDLGKKVKVKEYRIQGITNHNNRQIALLKPKEIDAISEVLKKKPDIISFFGYAIR